MRRIRKLQDAESGAILPFLAVILVTLLAIASFATDLGWFYLNSQRVQRAAEASALAGVVHMPQSYSTKAEPTARQVATANGYDDSVAGVDVVVSPIAGEPNQIEVTITDTVPTFFLSILGMDSQPITRTAIAEYVPPLRLGSPDNQFGNDCDPKDPSCPSQGNYWANIHGKFTDTRMGDAYSSYCADGSGSGSAGCSQNDAHRSRGYLYGIEADGASSFTVQFLDMAFHNISGGVATSDNHRTGDRGCEDWGNPSPNCGQTIRTTLYAPDPSPLDLSNNTPICSYDWAPRPQISATNAGSYVWETPTGCFTVSGAQAGVYVLQIQVLDPTNAKFSGLNRYSVGVASAGDQARLFGIGDVSIYNNAPGTPTEFYLAEVESYYRGKTFVVELYDPGEANPGGTVTIRQPAGGSWATYPSCRMFVRGDVDEAWSSRGTQSPCDFFANNSGGSNDYNGDWIKLEMDLPDTYSCTTNCWWKVLYDYPGNVNDTTTWRAYMIGNPVHLTR